MKPALAFFALLLAVFGFNFSQNYWSDPTGWLAVFAGFFIIVAFLAGVLRGEREMFKGDDAFRIGQHTVRGPSRPKSVWNPHRWVNVPVAAWWGGGFVLGVVLAHVPLAVAYAGWLAVAGMFAVAVWFFIAFWLDTLNIV